MNNISEDYCSFKVSRLLRAKGFNEVSSGGGVYSKPFDHSVSTYVGLPNSSFKEGDLDGIRNDPMLCTRPTVQLAVKWLRIKHGIHIYANPVSTIDRMFLNYTANYAKYAGDVPRFPDGEMVEGIWHFHNIGEVVESDKVCFGRAWQRTLFNTPEAAYEAALLHCLKHLI